MHILSIALGGCLRKEPVSYGITEDTGGHIAYILGEMRALAAHPAIDHAEIVTRLFDDESLGKAYSQKREKIAANFSITRIDSGNRRYLAKEDLSADRPAFIAALLAELRGRERLPDLIHAHFADAALVAAHVQRVLGIPYIYTAHSLGLDKLETLDAPCEALSARIAEEDQAIAGAAAIIGSSRDECERQLINYPSAQLRKIQRIVPGVTAVQPNEAQKSGVATEQAKHIIRPFLRDMDKPIVLAIARPVRKKNLAGLVDAFASNEWLRSNANLVILAGQRSSLGDGEREQADVLTDLVCRIDRHDLHGHVAYPKTHTTSDVAGLYELAAQSGGVFANPALVEPYGLTIVEAAAHGLPVVATKVGGPSDTLNELEHGLLVDPRDSAEIGGAVERLLRDRALWQNCSDNGRARSKSHSWKNYANHFVKVAQPIISPHPGTDTAIGSAVNALLVSDLDNTLTGCSNGVARLREFLAERPHFGFVVATGRSIIEARRIVREWDIPEPMAWITSVGTEIYWASAAGCTRDHSFPALRNTLWNPTLTAQIATGAADLQPQPDYEQREFKRSYFYSHGAEVDAVRRALTDAGLPVRVIASHDTMLDILPLCAGKAAAMRHVGAALGVPFSNIIAAGDSGNDEDMLTACQNAIIVQNHSQEIANLTRRPNVYLSRQSRAMGVVEGLMEHQRRMATQIRSERSQPPQVQTLLAEAM